MHHNNRGEEERMDISSSVFGLELTANSGHEIMVPLCSFSSNVNSLGGLRSKRVIYRIFHIHSA